MLLLSPLPRRSRTVSATAPAALNIAEFGARLGFDLVAMALFWFALHLRGHARRDLLMVFGLFNLGLVVVLTVISTSASATAIGFGLFAMLSIIRLRSEPFANSELGYFFVVLVLALINGVADTHLAFTALLDAVVLIAVFVVGHPRMGGPTPTRREITLDCIHDNDTALRADLEHRLGVRITDMAIAEIDYVREVTRLTISFHPMANVPVMA
jgi:hypothetical protein